MAVTIQSRRPTDNTSQINTIQDNKPRNTASADKKSENNGGLPGVLNGVSEFVGGGVNQVRQLFGMNPSSPATPTTPQTRPVQVRTPVEPTPVSPGDGTAMTRSVLPMGKLSAVQGSLVGPQMLIVDNPETFRKPGVLGSTMSAIPGRGGGEHLFNGTGELFALAQNGTGKPQRFQVAVHNPTDKPMTVTYEGLIYGKGVTKTDGSVQQNYQEGKFAGPHATAGMSYLNADVGQNGYMRNTVTIPPGGTVNVVNQYQEAGCEIFARGKLTATVDGKPANFSMAVAATPQTLNQAQLNDLAKGKLEAAGLPQDYAPADANKVGRPNGVMSGSIFQGGRTIDVGQVGDTGDLVMSTKFKNAGTTSEIPRLSNVPNNIEGTGQAATQNDGSYGVTYDLRYELNNTSNEDRVVQVLLTAPKRNPNDKHGPLGGQMTQPLKVNGNILPVRVDDLGDGVQVAKIRVPAGEKVDLQLDFTNLGNNFPPAGIEFRSKRP